MSPLSNFLTGAAVLCVAGMFAITPAKSSERAGEGVRAAAPIGQWEFSDQRRRYYYGPRRYYRPYYRPYRPYYRPYYAYPRRYYGPYRPYYRRPAPPFFPFF